MNTTPILLTRTRGGDCANFIASSIVYLLKEDTVDMDFSVDGDSHNYYRHYLEKENNPSVITLYQWFIDAERYRELTNSYPDHKIVHLYINDIRDCYLAECNRIFKNIIPQNENGLPSYFKKYPHLDKMSKKAAEVRIKKEATLHKLGVEKAKEIIISGINLSVTNTRLDVDDDVPQLNFHDIIYNPKPTMEWLSMITGKEITKSYRENYNSYLMLQRKLQDTYFPWLPEFLEYLPK